MNPGQLIGCTTLSLDYRTDNKNITHIVLILIYCHQKIKTRYMSSVKTRILLLCVLTVMYRCFKLLFCCDICRFDSLPSPLGPNSRLDVI